MTRSSMTTDGELFPQSQPAEIAVEAPYSKPDWSSIEKDICCALCGYNLRGLIDPRCPECGYQFTWPDLLDPSRQSHPYLFELHPREKFKSFWKTAFHGLRPLKFWKSVRADHKIVPARLWLYWLIVATFLILGLASYVGEFFWTYNVDRWGTGFAYASYPAWKGSSATPPSIVPDFSFEWPEVEFTPLAIATSIILAWPWLTLGSLQLLRASMRRAKIKTHHILRCIVYSWDIVLWAALLTFALNVSRSTTAFVYHFHPFSSADVVYYVNFPLTFWIALIPIFTYRMIIAYRRYLRFPHVIATIVLSQVMVALVVLIVVIYVTNPRVLNVFLSDILL